MGLTYSKDFSQVAAQYGPNYVITLDLDAISTTLTPTGVSLTDVVGRNCARKFYSANHFSIWDQNEYRMLLGIMDSGRYHPSTGWTIVGFTRRDGRVWVDTFAAVHPVHGRIWGRPDEKIWSDSRKTFEQFAKDHPFKPFCIT